jgi:AraC-like DNA-binding protein
VKTTIFDIVKGVYLSEVNEINTEMHMHPAVEIIVAKEGTFSIASNTLKLNGLKIAIIKENTLHSLNCSNCRIEILLIERHSKFVKQFLSELSIHLEDDIFTESELSTSDMISQIIEQIYTKDVQNTYDNRISTILNSLSLNSQSYQYLKENILKSFEISESRLSHLFKEQVGVSIKKYLVWNNLKHSINDYLVEKGDNQDLFDSIIDNGFYDQPHFNKSYKSKIGLSPGKVYNSASLQFKSIRTV